MVNKGHRYNEVVNFQVKPLLLRWLSLLIVGVLTLGPFLHGHFGHSHESGFHLDGVHALHASDPFSVKPLWAGDEESPALGVAKSLPHSADPGWPDGVTGFLLAVLPILLLRQVVCLPAARRHTRLRPLYRAGLPPPCLAPPSA